MKDLLQGIDTIILRVIDIAVSKRWYQEKLGFAVVWEDPILKLVVLDTGGPTSLTLWQTEVELVSHPDTAAYPIFRRRNAAEARQALSAIDVKTDPVITDHAVTWFRFYDPDNNVLEACQVHG